MRQAPLAARTQATGYDWAVRGPDEKAPGDPVNVALRVGSQLLPQLVGAQQQRNITGVLEISLADDPRPAVTGALVVGGLMPLQAQHPASSGGQMIGGGTSHTAQSHHDDVVTPCCADHIELPPDRGHLRIDDRLSMYDIGFQSPVRTNLPPKRPETGAITTVVAPEAHAPIQCTYQQPYPDSPFDICTRFGETARSRSAVRHQDARAVGTDGRYTPCTRTYGC